MNKRNNLISWQEKFSGALPFRMSNDFLFKILLQDDDSDILKGIICSYLDLQSNEIKSVKVTNSITMEDDVNSKEMILDIRAEMNDNAIVNLEMQVINYHDWPERSISYLCRCFDNLRRGEGYINVKGAVHIGFLDYTLFPDNPEFYSTYRLINEKTGKLYTSKFRISVVDLNLRSKATDEDKLSHRDLWASFFKSTSWEELRMLEKQDENIAKAVEKVHILSEDEKFRMKCEAREDHIRQEIDREYHWKTEMQKMSDAIAEKDNAIAEKDNAIAEQKNVIAEQEMLIKKLKEQLGIR